MTGDDSETVEDNYKVPAKVPLDELLERDKEDAALESYKKQLLGTSTFSPSDDPRRVVIVELHIIFQGPPESETVFDGLDNPETLSKLKDTSIVFKEGCHYKLKFVFRVQHDIVTGLKYVNKIYKSSVKVANEQLMLGSYPPQETPHVVVWPRHGWEEAPSGLFSRGKYASVISFIDDDKVKHLSFEYHFSIKKNWPDGDPKASS